MRAVIFLGRGCSCKDRDLATHTGNGNFGKLKKIGLDSHHIFAQWLVNISIDQFLQAAVV